MEAVDTSKYAPDLVDAFVESIENSKNLLHNPSTITISDMKTAISNMETAYNNLVVDKSEKNYIKLNIEYNINILDLFKGKNEINILIEYNI